MASRTVSVKLMAEVGSYVAGMNKASAATMRLGESATANTKKTQGGFDLAGKSALLLGGAVAGGLAMAVRSSMNFEKSMSAVGAATRATGSTLDGLRAAAMKAGADTAYSATEAADAITEMGKAGVSAKDIMGGGLTGALSLAAAGQMEVADAAGIASTAMTQFNLSGKDLPHVADLLAAGAGKAMGEVSDLGMALNQAGLVASSAGLSIEETTGTLAAFASAGLIGSDAGTSLRSALLHLQNATGPAQEAMDEYGISLYDAQGNFVGMSALAGQLHDKMSGLTPAVRDAAMAQIFGSDAVRAANVLYKEGAAGITEWTAKVNDAGFASETAAKLQDNLAGDLEKLGGSFETLMISMGSGAQGPLRGIVQGFTDILDIAAGVIDFWTSLPGPVQLGVVALGAIAALKGPVGTALETIGLKALYLKDSISGASLGMSGFKSAAGGVVGMFGGPWGVALAAGTVLVGSFMSSLDEAESATDRWTQALLKGGEAARKAREDYNNGDYFLRSLDEWTGLAPSLEDAEKAARDYFNSLSPIEQAQAKVSQWTNELAYRMEHLGTTHENTRIAQERLTYWTNLLGERQGFLKAATESTTGATNSGATAQDKFAAATEAAKAEVDAGKKAVDGLKMSLDVLTGNTVSQIQADVAFGDAVRSATGAVKGLDGSVLKADGTLNTYTESGSKASGVLIDIMNSGNLAIATMKAHGATNDQVRAKEDELRRSFIAAAGQMGINGTAAEKLADQILGIPSKRNTVVTADTSGAESQISKFMQQRRTITIGTRTVTARVGTSYQDAGPGLASGGWVQGPGTATSDSVPARLSNGEFVVNARAAQSNGQLLEALNGGSLAGFARGGWVGGSKLGSIQYPTAADTSGLASGLNAAASAAASAMEPNYSGSATASSSALVAFGHLLQRMGARVSEHPAFGGVTAGAHVRGSKHYSGRAIDVNTRAGTSSLEQRELAPMMAMARAAGFQTIFMAPGHFNHGHVASYKTGTNYVPKDGYAYLHQGERVVPREQNLRSREFSGGGMGGGSVVRNESRSQVINISAPDPSARTIAAKVRDVQRDLEFLHG